MSRANFTGECIWIIGASSGIGRALAVHLHHHGAELILSARSADALQKLNAELGGKHHIIPCDVGEPATLEAAKQALQQMTPRVDRIIHLAALYEPMPLHALDMEKVAAIVQVNLVGTFALVHTVLPMLKAQGNGQLALCGSVAGYIGLPNGQPYSATKAAVTNLAESLRAECPSSIDIKLISPGFVRTALTAKNSFSMPMLMEPEDAAKAIAKGLKSSAFEIHFPKAFTCILKLLQRLPYWALNPLLRQFNR
jgi:short-subunit dehydrogenase